MTRRERIASVEAWKRGLNVSFSAKPFPATELPANRHPKVGRCGVTFAEAFGREDTARQLGPEAFSRTMRPWRAPVYGPESFRNFTVRASAGADLREYSFKAECSEELALRLVLEDDDFLLRDKGIVWRCRATDMTVASARNHPSRGGWVPISGDIDSDWRQPNPNRECGHQLIQEVDICELCDIDWLLETENVDAEEAEEMLALRAGVVARLRGERRRVIRGQ